MPLFYVEFSKCSYSRAFAPSCGALVLHMVVIILIKFVRIDSVMSELLPSY